MRREAFWEEAVARKRASGAPPDCIQGCAFERRAHKQPSTNERYSSRAFSNIKAALKMMGARQRTSLYAELAPRASYICIITSSIDGGHAHACRRVSEQNTGPQPLA